MEYYGITDEQRLLIESVREWCAQHITEEKVQEWYKAGNIPVELTKSWVDSGFGMLGIPEEYGGTPCDNTTLCLVNEELCRAACAQMPMSLTTLVMFDIVHLGTPEQIKMCMDVYKDTGKALVSLAISEPGAGSDNMGMTTVAKTREDGKIVLTGQKTWVTNGEHTPLCLVVAKDEDPARENNKMSLWLVSMDAPGVSTAPLHKIGNQIAPFCEVYFDDVVLEPTALVGDRGSGFMALMKNFEFERCSVVAAMLGQAQAAMEDAAAYVSVRKAFGQPIANFQLIQEKLTDMEIRLENTRNMLYKTVWKLQNGERIQIDAALLKRYGAPACTAVASDAIGIFGGLGYTTETRVGRAMLDCRGLEIGGGTTDIMVHIAGRQLAKKYKKD